MYYNDTFKEFNFDRDFEAVVLDSSDFDYKQEVKLFVFELMMTTLQENALSINKQINKSNLINHNKHNINENINIGNYLICKPLLDNDINKIRKPNKYDKVILRFHNGNPKMPYYIDKHLPLKVEKDIYTEDLFTPIKGIYYRLLVYRVENMTGIDVDGIGKALNLLKYNVKPYNNQNNYKYDLNFQKAVLKFQLENGLTQDGEIGPVTYRKIVEKYNSKGRK